ncbi:hypothetical protein SDC9_52383 [bioreactor metagenome]|uniref:Secretion system C-terminal sorting domain-containing protein n=1 Tax=bioreactor metagenome TaxID=1076179 RepID=A0A644WRK0_9ZZZZ
MRFLIKLNVAIVFLFSAYNNIHGQTSTELWGMTTFGGNGFGVIFKTDGDGENMQCVYKFGGAAVKNSNYTNLYETPYEERLNMINPGDSSGPSVLYEINLDDLPITSLSDLSGTEDGTLPYGSLVQGTNGKLYGMTKMGGQYNYGVIFEFNPDSLTYKSISFDNAGIVGRTPSGSLIKASNQKLYGMTASGGMANYGVIFEYDPQTNSYSGIFDFVNSAGGKTPESSLLEVNEKLYGMTKYGGTNNCGILFEYDPASSVFIKLHDFTTSSGSSPYGSLIEASDGKLYGLTKSGGSHGSGTLFEFDLSDSTYTKKIDFDETNTGSEPSGSLIQGSNGKLYGLTLAGGQNGMGVLFEYDINNSIISNKFNFDGTSHGSYPNGSLMQAANGKMYGLTNRGGNSDLGVMFEYDPATETVIKKYDFSDSDGKSPMYCQLIEINIPIGVQELTTDHNKIIIYPNPASDKVIIEIENPGMNNFSFMNSNGVILKSGSTSGLKSICIDIHGYNPGAYFINIRNQNGSQTKQLIIE